MERSGVSRRELAGAAAALAVGGALTPLPAAAAAGEPWGLCLNEDDSHYFGTRAGQNLDGAAVASWVDQYAGTQVRELMLCPNCMRTSYASHVWDPIWRGYDPGGPDDQPLLASTPPESRAGARRWIHTAWKLDHDGIDPYALWIARARKHAISPWISMRMNDVHCVDDPKSYIHSEFWRANPHLRRTPDRFVEWVDRAFDYGHPEVRAYHMELVKELLERYDCDGIELDWMRFGYHFRPGREAEGVEHINAFMAEVRRLANRAGRRRGRRVGVGARVPSRPQTSVNLGMDAVNWARRGWVDRLVVTPFWATAETDMPMELWRQLLHGTRTQLAAGLEILVRPFPEYGVNQTNSLETVRGMAASLLDRGAERVYLFNYMDSETAIDDLTNYATLLRECGRLTTLAGKPRRHVVTYADTWAPGEPRGHALPQSCQPGRWNSIRVHTGPRPEGAPVAIRLGVDGADTLSCSGWDVRMNRERCTFVGDAGAIKPGPNCPVMVWRPPTDSLGRGANLIEVEARSAARIIWAEVRIG